jgi:hypothetical protein
MDYTDHSESSPVGCNARRRSLHKASITERVLALNPALNRKLSAKRTHESLLKMLSSTTTMIMKCNNHMTMYEKPLSSLIR